MKGKLCWCWLGSDAGTGSVLCEVVGFPNAFAPLRQLGAHRPIGEVLRSRDLHSLWPLHGDSMDPRHHPYVLPVAPCSNIVKDTALYCPLTVFVFDLPRAKALYNTEAFSLQAHSSFPSFDSHKINRLFSSSLSRTAETLLLHTSPLSSRFNSASSGPLMNSPYFSSSGNGIRF